MVRVLVAGGTGALGRFVVRELKARGHEVSVLTRRRRRAEALGLDEGAIREADARRGGQALKDALREVDVVVSALGAPVSPSLLPWRGFEAIDTRANLKLLEAAREMGVGRFVYVSTFGRGQVDDLAYVRAHEKVADALASSSLSFTVLRPTGYYSAFAPFVQMARTGRLVELGGPPVRTNPIHDEDLAAVVADVLLEGPDGVDAGGPDLLTRREIGELAFSAVGKEPRFIRVPSGVVRALSRLAHPLHPRMAELSAFFERIYREELVAPVRGSRRLGDFFRAGAARG